MSQTADEYLREIDAALNELMCSLPIPPDDDIPQPSKDDIIKSAIIEYSSFVLKCSAIIRKYRNGLYQ